MCFLVLLSQLTVHFNTLVINTEDRVLENTLTLRDNGTDFHRQINMNTGFRSVTYPWDGKSEIRITNKVGKDWKSNKLRNKVVKTINGNRGGGQADLKSSTLE